MDRMPVKNSGMLFATPEDGGLHGSPADRQVGGGAGTRDGGEPQRSGHGVRSGCQFAKSLCKPDARDQAVGRQVDSARIDAARRWEEHSWLIFPIAEELCNGSRGQRYALTGCRRTLCREQKSTAASSQWQKNSMQGTEPHKKETPWLSTLPGTISTSISPFTINTTAPATVPGASSSASCSGVTRSVVAIRARRYS